MSVVPLSTSTLSASVSTHKFSRLISIHLLKEVVEKNWQKIFGDHFISCQNIFAALKSILQWENWRWSLLRLKRLKCDIQLVELSMQLALISYSNVNYWPLLLKSSTITTSCNICGGDLLITLCTVRNNVDQPSLWNTITTLAFGRLHGYVRFLHLKEIKS